MKSFGFGSAQVLFDLASRYQLVCTPNYSVVDGGINRAGPWGLSERVAGEFGDQESAEAVADETQPTSLRMYPRWSASTLAIGLREVQFALLTSDTGPRPPTVPSQAHLWTLALWDAYNRLPSQQVVLWISLWDIASKR